MRLESQEHSRNMLGVGCGLEVSRKLPRSKWWSKSDDVFCTGDGGMAEWTVGYVQLFSDRTATTLKSTALGFILSLGADECLRATKTVAYREQPEAGCISVRDCEKRWGDGSVRITCRQVCCIHFCTGRLEADQRWKRSVHAAVRKQKMKIVCKRILDILKLLDRCGSVRFEVNADERNNWMYFPIMLSRYSYIPEINDISCAKYGLEVTANPCFTHNMATANHVTHALDTARVKAMCNMIGHSAKRTGSETSGMLNIERNYTSENKFKICMEETWK